ncbi:glycoside hydrolase [Vararia minispora EC-137]|uniref:Glycoside hydrolase n=1 Tax=Vararia minispora EC-137 TaxID=1314806 RepID=A0ACB8Q7V4_9AGAM|nr:glycoside hydrolase [Vararia minispora EC-137]
MRTLASIVVATVISRPVLAQYSIWDLWQTTWDRSKLFTSLAPSSPFNFGTPGAIGQADIVVDDSTVYQQMDGFGGSLTDSAATVLVNLKNRNLNNYNALMRTLFDPTDGASSAGLNIIRIPIGASDYSAMDYSLDDVNGDTSLNSFSINNVPQNVFTVLNDIKSLNQYTKVLITPWSPPAWMKDSGTMNGGSLNTGMVNTYANYLLKTVQGFSSKGTVPWAVSIQNEPENSQGSYPTCSMPANIMAQIGTALRTLLNNNGFSSVKLIGYDHNWDNAGTYPVQLMQDSNAFNGVAFHCYGGSVSNQDAFHNAYPNKEIYFTECTGTYGSDWWSDIKWNVDHITAGAIEHNARTALLWNIALDGNGNPHLPSQTPCGSAGCRPIATVNSDGSYSVNQEYYNLAQASRAVLPRDVGGPFGQRIAVSLGGGLSWALRVTAFVTGRTNPSDWRRYSLVVLNWDDSASTTWNPQPVTATIEFRGTQARYTFPVGITTLWWYAPN